MMEASMNELLAKIIDAHGGMDRWKAYKKVDAIIVSGGGFFPLKGMTGHRPAAHERVATRGTCVSLTLWGARSALGFYARENHHREGRWYVDRQRILSPAIR
jgi:hypothetical protein